MAIRTNPFDEMDRVMDQFRRSVYGNWPAMGGWERGHGSNLSLETDEEGYVVLADLPGFEKEEIELRFEDGLLSIRAEHELNEEQEFAGGRAHSARSRHVHEQLRIPAEVEAERISASYRNGVLEVHLPTVEAVDDEDSVIHID
jgi:HSP20 family protein